MGYKFDVKKTTEDLIQWIKDWFEENGKDCNAVIGISGGKDSTVVAKLCVEALGDDRVVGVLIPDDYYADTDDGALADGIRICELLGIKNYEMCIEDVIYYFRYMLEKGNILMSEQARINMPARIRMTTLYAVSQSMNGRVANTCNLSEDWVGYATRYGDGAGDFSPLSNLTVSEIIQIGEYLGVPSEFIHKTPTDGLCGMTDEENLGFTYEVLDRYIREGVIDDIEIQEKIEDMHNKNLFKLRLMDCFEPERPKEWHYNSDGIVMRTENGDGTCVTTKIYSNGGKVMAETVRKTTYETGDKVYYKNGFYHEDSYGKGRKGNQQLKQFVYITKINESGSYPYHLSVGNILGDRDLGWVKFTQLR